ncbi:MAG: CrcB family protein [Streptosporangiaceae bacterium]
MNAFMVTLGAMLGAPARYLTDRAVQARYTSGFPWGIFTVNVAGSALLGFLVALPADNALMTFAGTGFCGALSTYSTFGYETVMLLDNGFRTAAVFNVVASVAAGLGAAVCGMTLAEALTG